MLWQKLSGKLWRFGLIIFFGMSIVVPKDYLFAKTIGQVLPSVALTLEENCTQPANPVVAENCLPGTDEWNIKTLATTIKGFTSPSSVNIGDKIDFKIQTSAPSFNLYLYRSGYYNGLGGRLIQVFKDIPSSPQPACNVDHPSGLSSCSNWTASYSLTIPSNWVSGVYVGVIENPVDGQRNYVVFVLRDDQRHSAMLYEIATATYQAYNPFNGKSIYNYNSSFCPTTANARHAAKVSYNRPVDTDRTNANTYLFIDYNMVYWLESQGYDVSYIDSTDLNRYGKPNSDNGLLDHKMLLIAGHDEYWSTEMRDAVVQARDKGVHLAFFSSNVMYWHIRFEPDPFTGEPDQVIVGYKTTEGHATDPSGIPTGTWRDPEGSDNPESNVVGIQYIGDNDSAFFPIQVSASMAKDQIYRHTDLQQMPPDTVVHLGKGLIGWEWDAVNPDHAPDGLTVLAESPTYGGLLTDSGNYLNNQLGIGKANVTRYVAPSGAIVFAAGTNLWARGLALTEPNAYIQQITYNVFADMGVQPATPSSNIVLDNETKIIVPHDGDRSPFYSESQQPISPATITNITTAINGIDVTVNWNTDVETVGQVFVGDTPDTLNQILGKDTASFQSQHSVNLISLNFNQTYYYKIATLNSDGQFSFSDLQTFKTGTSLGKQAVNAATDMARTVRCWALVNPVPTVLLGGFGLLILLIAAVAVIVLVTRRRRSVVQKIDTGSH